MYAPDDTFNPDKVAARSLSPTDDETEYFVIFEFAVPETAKVPVARQYIAVANLIRPASVTSTVPSQIPAHFRASNTARRAGWCITATLAASQPIRALTSC